jgi:serine/threonine protein kinase
VHRDVKPGNLMVSPDGIVKLADFGIAKAAEQSSITQVGSVLGTAAYLAPEQARGEEAGPAADLYALGVVTYQLTSGRLPYDATSLTELAFKQQNERPPRLDEVATGVPPALGVAVARALAREPAVLLLDEPLSALDAKIRVRLRGEIRKLQQQLGIAALYVTHDQEEALAIADRVAVMRGGRVEQIGPPEEIYAAPRTDFVADFIGLSNLLPCRVLTAGQGVVDWEGERLYAPVGDVPDGATITLMIRPEKITLTTDAPRPDINRVEGVLEALTFLGPFVRLEVVAHGRSLWVDIPHSQAGALARRKPVTLAFDPSDAVVLRGSPPA